MTTQTFYFHQPVTLAADPAFLGYVVGRLTSGQDTPATAPVSCPAPNVPQLMIAIARPGRSGQPRGSNRPFPLAEVRPATPKGK